MCSVACRAGDSTQRSGWKVAEISVHSLVLWGQQDGILDGGEMLRLDGWFLCLEFPKVAAAPLVAAYNA